MGAILSLPITLLNLLLPFTKPGTPLLQDIIHATILCGTLYYAPQIAEWYNAAQASNTPHPEPQGQGQGQDQDNTHHAPDRPEALHHSHPNPAAPPAAAQPRGPLQPQIEDDPEIPLPQPGPANDPAAAPEPAFFEDGDPGPANQHADRPRPTPANRIVGAKKAKSLARKDQRRAYHEFHRQEAELRRLQEAEGKEERDAALAAEKARRGAAEAEIAERERREREEAKREREREAEAEAERRERVVAAVRSAVEERGAVDLGAVAWGEGKERVWVERLVRASGVLLQLEQGLGGKLLLTGHGWLVRVDRELLGQVWAEAERVGDANQGRVRFEEFGDMLERAVVARGRFGGGSVWGRAKEAIDELM